MTFGERIKAARKERGLTLDQLAKTVSTHKGYISGTEHGKVNPPAPKMTRRLARALGLDPEAMVFYGWWEKRPAGVEIELVRKLLP